MAHCITRLLQTSFPRDAQLVFQMNVGGRQKNVDPRSRRSLQGLPRAVNVAGAGARQSGDNRMPHFSGNKLHRFKVTIGGDREPGLDHVHAQPVELLGQTQFFLHIHAATRRLLAVPQRGVKDNDARQIHEFRSSGALFLLLKL